MELFSFQLNIIVPFASCCFTTVYCSVNRTEPTCQTVFRTDLWNICIDLQSPAAACCRMLALVLSIANYKCVHI